LDQVSEFDCVVITTDHSDVDYRALVEKARLVVDTRNATKAVRGVFAERIVLL
jgi:UDP-N-acetyl-D-glucosamine dehydrogenase